MISEQYTDDFATYIVSIPFDYSRVPNNRGGGGGGWEFLQKLIIGRGVKNVHVFLKIFSIKRSTHMQNDNKKRGWLLNLKTIYYNAMVSVACM